MGAGTGDGPLTGDGSPSRVTCVALCGSRPDFGPRTLLRTLPLGARALGHSALGAGSSPPAIQKQAIPPHNRQSSSRPVQLPPSTDPPILFGLTLHRRRVRVHEPVLRRGLTAIAMVMMVIAYLVSPLVQ